MEENVNNTCFIVHHPVLAALQAPQEEELIGARWPYQDLKVPEALYRPVGCRNCANTGYRGRIAIHESICDGSIVAGPIPTGCCSHAEPAPTLCSCPTRSATSRYRTEAESAPLLKFLVEHITQPAFTCRLRWEPHTYVCWDNRICVHQAFNDYDNFRRELYRTTIAGEAPV